MSQTQPEANGKKRRFYHNITDAYTLTKRTYPKLPWILLGAFVAPIVIFAIIGYFINHPIYFPILGVMVGILLAMLILGRLMPKAMYAQLDGRPGAVGAVLNQLRRGWIIPDQPCAFNRKQDLVWRLVGRPGIVLISEGPAARVGQLLREETRKANRVAPQVPVHQIQVGHEEGQVPLAKAMKQLRKLKKEIGKQEVPIVGQRLASLETKNLPIPKGIDPNKAKFSRRALRGK